jgi:hypothetical protein
MLGTNISVDFWLGVYFVGQRNRKVTWRIKRRQAEEI